MINEKRGVKKNSIAKFKNDWINFTGEKKPSIKIMTEKCEQDWPVGGGI